MTTYTQNCAQCGQSWTGWGNVCNDCQRMKLLKEANDAQAENMREQTRYRDDAIQKQRDDARADREWAREVAKEKKWAEDARQLRVKEITHPGWGRAIALRQQMESTSSNAHYARHTEWLNKTTKSLQLNNNIIWGIGSIIAIIILFVFFGPWTTDWMPLKLIGLTIWWISWAKSDAEKVRSVYYTSEPGQRWSTDMLPTVDEVYKKMLADDAASYLPPMPGTTTPAKARKEPLFK